VELLCLIYFFSGRRKSQYRRAGNTARSGCEESLREVSIARDKRKEEGNAPPNRHGYPSSSSRAAAATTVALGSYSSYSRRESGVSGPRLERGSIASPRGSTKDFPEPEHARLVLLRFPSSVSRVSALRIVSRNVDMYENTQSRCFHTNDAARS